LSDEHMGTSVAQCIAEFAPLEHDEVVTILHACTYELARRSEQTPRSVAEALFVAMPDDGLWRDHVLPVVSAYVEEELESTG
jgi:hypothetical protein